MEPSDIQSILRLFKGSLFPRTISTYATGGRQVSITSIDEIISLFEEANFVDCRINSFPVMAIIPDFVMADLDLSKFRTERLLIKALDESVENISQDLPGTVPMVLFTGGGYHVYQPIDMPVLEEESIFRFFDNPSTEFIRYVAQRWTNGKNDTCNKPSVKSCLLRVPGSINSKNMKQVEIVQNWNGKRPAANKLLSDFYIKLAAKELKDADGSKAKSANYSHYYFPPTSHHFIGKTYVHYGHVVPTYPGPSAYDGIKWIDSILSNGGMMDGRKMMIDLVLAPYLVNVKQCDYDDAYNTIINWLNMCSQNRKLDFNPRLKVRYALNRSKHNRIRPMRLVIMKENYAHLYQEVFSG